VLPEVKVRKEKAVMKSSALILVVLITGLTAPAQAASVRDPIQPLLVVEYDWYRDSPSLVGDFSIGAENESCGDVDSYQHRLRPCGCYTQPDSQPCTSDSRVHRNARVGDYVYRVKVQNHSIKIITAIVWDYVFVDPETNAELARHTFYSESKLSPGKTKTLVAVSPKPPTRVISAGLLYRKASDPYLERVEMRSVVYISSGADPRSNRK
jgi:hypothetical protein